MISNYPLLKVEKLVFEIKVRSLLPFLAVLVVTPTTPLAPREPYNEVAEASFKTDRRSISFGFKFGVPCIITPSTTHNGLTRPSIEDTPRIRISGTEPG